MKELILAIAIGSIAGAAAAEDAAAAPSPKEALLFKSGQSFLFRELELPADSTSARLAAPPAVHGTVWLGSEGFDVTGARASWTTVESARDVESLGGALQMAHGRRVVLDVMEGNQAARLEGVVTRLIGSVAETPAGAEPVEAPPQAVVLETRFSQSLPGGAQAVERIRTRVLPVSRILGIEFQDESELPWRYGFTSKKPVLDVALTPRAEGRHSLGLATMSSGLAWAPSCVLNLGEGGRAKLVGKAVVINDLEDLEDTLVRMVVGYPNLRFAGVQTPLLPEVSFDQFRSLLSAPEAASMRGRAAAMSQIMSNDAYWSPAFTAAPEVPAAGESAEDLYIYEAGRMTLARGERAYVPLFASDIAFHHRFDWTLPDLVDRNARFLEDEAADEPEPVWHVLRLENDTGAPWTTAPVLVCNASGPLAQSQMSYTAAGGETTVRLTRALDLVGEAIEYRADDEQSSREEVRIFGRRFEIVTVNGKLELANHSDRLAPMRIEKQLSGDLLSSTQDPEVRGRAKGLGQINAVRELVWEFDLEPGQTWSADYQYRVLILR